MEDVAHFLEELKKQPLTIAAPTNMEIQKIKQYIDRHDLFSSRDKILVALSGGAASLARTEEGRVGRGGRSWGGPYL